MGKPTKPTLTIFNRLRRIFGFQIEHVKPKPEIQPAELIFYSERGPTSVLATWIPYPLNAAGFAKWQTIVTKVKS